jgi:hypothetical protein
MSWGDCFSASPLTDAVLNPHTINSVFLPGRYRVRSLPSQEVIRRFACPPPGVPTCPCQRFDLFVKLQLH